MTTKQITFGLMSFNIRRGNGFLGLRSVDHQLVTLIKQHNPAVICLQEVWRPNHFTRSRLERLCADSWPSQCFGTTAEFDRGIQGNAILSKHPLESWRNYVSSFAGREPRGILHATLRISGKLCHVLCIHFGLKAAERRCQLRDLMQVIETIQPTERIIIAGDFNDWRMQLMGDMEKAGFVEAFSSFYGKPPRTFPAVLPVLPLDRVHTRGVTVSATRLLHNFRIPLSDHLPYLVDVIM